MELKAETYEVIKAEIDKTLKMYGGLKVNEVNVHVQGVNTENLGAEVNEEDDTENEVNDNTKE